MVQFTGEESKKVGLEKFVFTKNLKNILNNYLLPYHFVYYYFVYYIFLYWKTKKNPSVWMERDSVFDFFLPTFWKVGYMSSIREVP